MAPAFASAKFRMVDDPTIRVHVSELACCALEVSSAVTLGLLTYETSADQAPRINVLLVSGSVTDLLAPAVQAQWDAIDSPRLALAIGACASSGGPYWDSLVVRNGIGDLIQTAGFIAGCPPDPRQIIDGVLALVPSP